MLLIRLVLGQTRFSVLLNMRINIRWYDINIMLRKKQKYWIFENDETYKIQTAEIQVENKLIVK